MKIALVVPAIVLVIAAYFLLSGLGAEEDVRLFGAVTMRSKGAIFLGGIGVFGAVAIAIEMLRDKQKAPAAGR